MINRAGRGFGNHRGEPDGPSFRNKDAMRAGPFRRPENGTEVVRVFDSIQNHKQRWFLSLDRAIQNLLLSLIGFGCSKGNHTLMLPIGNKAVEGTDGLDMNGNPTRSGQLDKIRELFIGSKNQDPLEWTASGFQCFPDGMQTVEDFLRVSASIGWCHRACPRS
jgi:hypothetical protein